MADALPFILILSITLLIYYFSRRSALPKPPGPRGWPILGNIFENPVSHKQRKYKEWGDKYGPIVRYSLFTDEIIVLNTRETATELLEKRSASSQDRPRQIMCGELMNWNKAMGLSRAGYQHRTYRKLVGGVLSPTAVRNLFPVEERAARLFVHDLLRQCSAASTEKNVDPTKPLQLLRRSVGRNVAGIIFGADFAPEGRTGQGLTLEEVDQYIYDADVAHAKFGRALVPFAYMVDWMPWLKHVPEWFPFAGFQRDARLAREDLEVLTWVPFNKTLERINSGNSQPCYVEFCLDANPNPTPEELDHIAWTAMSAFTGGTDTTIGTLSTFFLAISLHPEVQKLAQQEIDEVIGPDRMPSLADRDRDQLPYVSALVQECLRSAPAFPYGVSHRAMKDEILDGYFIAKGSTVIANLWGILHDESVYQSPHSFEPERFLPKTGTPTNPNIPGRNEPGIGSIPWGYGRRLCPGMAMADSSVWIYVASVLWAFDISSTDKDLTWQNAKWNDGAFLFPLPFGTRLVPRRSVSSIVTESEK